MVATSPYNYESYSFALEQPELDRWPTAGPHPGEVAPDFRLEDLDGEPVRLWHCAERRWCSSSALTAARSSPTGYRR